MTVDQLSKAASKSGPVSVQSPQLSNTRIPKVESGRLSSAALQRVFANPSLAPSASILQLQRNYGNQAVNSLVQTKLRVGPAGDKYEQEADRVANRVMRMPSPIAKKPLQRQEDEEELQMKPLVQRQTPEDEEELQTKPLVTQRYPIVNRQSSTQNQQNGFETSNNFDRRLSAAGGGNPLPAQLRADFEPKFGVNFDGVRVHADGKAAQLNRAIGSRAFTRGKDIFFGGGQYQPDSTLGKQLIAHELTHTVQQGASTDRISAWWPKGHRLVTELGIEEGGFSGSFDETARKFLIDNSPDMDYIQDVYDTMGEGGKIGDTRLGLYEGLIESGEEDKLKRAKKMYTNNELHIRRRVYMQMHGEAGEYKVNRPTAAARNAAVTSKFVQKAVALWPGETGATAAKMQSLTVLSDALHQAGDRGSHEEGAAFQGHDVRLQLGVKGQGKYAHWYKKNREPQSWEVPFGGSKEGKGGPEWDTDNFVVNKEGLVLGVGFVQGALKKFIDGIDLHPEQGEKVDIYGLDQPEKRKMKAAALAPKSTSGSVLTSLGVTFAGKTGLGVKGTLRHLQKDKTKLREVFRNAKREMRAYDKKKDANSETRYVKTLQPVSDVVPDDFGNLLTQGMAFYDTGAKREQTINAAETYFKDLKLREKRGDIDADVRRAQAKTLFRRRVALAGLRSAEDKILFAKHIKIAYKNVFGVSLNVEGPIDEPKTDYDVAAETYAHAHGYFKQMGKWMLRGGTTKGQRRYWAGVYLQKHGNTDVERDAIKMAYRNLFGEELPERPQEEPEPETDEEIARDAYNKAYKLFKQWGKSRLRGGLKKKERVRKAQEHYQKLKDSHIEYNAAHQAYVDVFGGPLWAGF